LLTVNPENGWFHIPKSLFYGSTGSARPLGRFSVSGHAHTALRATLVDFAEHLGITMVKKNIIFLMATTWVKV